jgi:hypothetical protein
VVSVAAAGKGGLRAPHSTLILVKPPAPRSIARPSTMMPTAPLPSPAAPVSIVTSSSGDAFPAARGPPLLRTRAMVASSSTDAAGDSVEATLALPPVLPAPPPPAAAVFTTPLSRLPALQAQTQQLNRLIAARLALPAPPLLAAPGSRKADLAPPLIMDTVSGDRSGTASPPPVSLDAPPMKPSVPVVAARVLHPGALAHVVDAAMMSKLHQHHDESPGPFSGIA